MDKKMSKNGKLAGRRQAQDAELTSLGLSEEELEELGGIYTGPLAPDYKEKMWALLLAMMAISDHDEKTGIDHEEPFIASIEIDDLLDEMKRLDLADGFGETEDSLMG